MKTLVYLLMILFFIRCSPAKPKPTTKKKSAPIVHNMDTNIQNPQAVIETDPNNKIVATKIDTSTLKGKREYLMNQFLIWNEPSGPDYDTLMDLNFDGKEDYVIGYYRQAGTGIKNGIKVWLFNRKSGCYQLNEHLSKLSNPTFYLKRRQITWFYIGHGAGEGGHLKWINGNWTTTKEFHVDNNDEQTIWEINYPLKKITQQIHKPFEMIPPADILETSY